MGMGGILKMFGFLFFGIFLLTPTVAIQAQEDVTAEEAGLEDTDIVAGKIVSVDEGNSAVTVVDDTGVNQTIKVIKEETSIWRGDDTITIADLKKDETVELEYYTDDKGDKVAIWIDVLLEELPPLPKEVQTQKGTGE